MAADPMPPLKIAHASLSRVNNLIIDAQKLGASSRRDTNDAYGALLGSKHELCEYIAKLEARCGIVQGALVKF